MSSWLDNIAAHYEEEDEEDYESQPQLKQSQQQQPQPQQQPLDGKQQQQQEQQKQSQQQQDSHNNPSNQPQLQSQQLQQSDSQINSHEEKSNFPISTEIKETNQSKLKSEPPDDKEINTNKTKPDNTTKKQAYSNTITKEMYKFDKSINALLKRQEFYYASSMIKTRSSVDFALERTSKPIQTIGGLGTVSLEAKGKYDNLNKRILNIQPLCVVNPKTK